MTLSNFLSALVGDLVFWGLPSDAVMGRHISCGMLLQKPIRQMQHETKVIAVLYCGSAFTLFVSFSTGTNPALFHIFCFNANSA